MDGISNIFIDKLLFWSLKNGLCYNLVLFYYDLIIELRVVHQPRTELGRIYDIAVHTGL